MVQPFSNNYPSCIVAEKSTLGVNYKLTLLDNLLEQYFWLFEILRQKYIGLIFSAENLLESSRPEPDFCNSRIWHVFNSSRKFYIR